MFVSFILEQREICSIVGVSYLTSYYENNNDHSLNLNNTNANNNNVWQITQAHSQMIRDMDFNPNSQHYLATGGDDCQVKFWDIRDTTKPILKMLHHTHWVWSVRYNSFHDHLVLSSSSDGNVNLLRISSIASQPYGQLIEQEDLLDKEEDFNIKRLLISSNQQSNQNLWKIVHHMDDQHYDV